ncbi:hypothetical protein BC941DRAFT_403317 [Chlamydoabsidia padenii]|nr:hypothetical protein BC941DRAFT_403317 [Chlamydoabsidia padenii]
MLFPCILILFYATFSFTAGVPILQHRSLDEGTSYTGTGTYYEVAAGTGSCGESDTDDERVVAMNRLQMKNGVDPNLNPECEKHVVIQGERGMTTARVVDTCASCSVEGDLDLSPRVFELVCGDESMGTCDIEWQFKQN